MSLIDYKEKPATFVSEPIYTYTSGKLLFTLTTFFSKGILTFRTKKITTKSLFYFGFFKFLTFFEIIILTIGLINVGSYYFNIVMNISFEERRDCAEGLLLWMAYKKGGFINNLVRLFSSQSLQLSLNNLRYRKSADLISKRFTEKQIETYRSLNFFKERSDFLLFHNREQCRKVIFYKETSTRQNNKNVYLNFPFYLTTFIERKISQGFFFIENQIEKKIRNTDLSLRAVINYFFNLFKIFLTLIPSLFFFVEDFLELYILTTDSFFYFTVNTIKTIIIKNIEKSTAHFDESDVYIFLANRLRLLVILAAVVAYCIYKRITSGATPRSTSLSVVGALPQIFKILTTGLIFFVLEEAPIFLRHLIFENNNKTYCDLYLAPKEEYSITYLKNTNINQNTRKLFSYGELKKSPLNQNYVRSEIDPKYQKILFITDLQDYFNGNKGLSGFMCKDYHVSIEDSKPVLYTSENIILTAYQKLVCEKYGLNIKKVLKNELREITNQETEKDDEITREIVEEVEMRKKIKELSHNYESLKIAVRHLEDLKEMRGLGGGLAMRLKRDPDFLKEVNKLFTKAERDLKEFEEGLTGRQRGEVLLNIKNHLPADKKIYLNYRKKELKVLTMVIYHLILENRHIPELIPIFNNLGKTIKENTENQPFIINKNIYYTHSLFNNEILDVVSRIRNMPDSDLLSYHINLLRFTSLIDFDNIGVFKGLAIENIIYHTEYKSILNAILNNYNIKEDLKNFRDLKSLKKTFRILKALFLDVLSISIKKGIRSFIKIEKLIVFNFLFYSLFNVFAAVLLKTVSNFFKLLKIEATTEFHNPLEKNIILNLLVKNSTTTDSLIVVLFNRILFARESPALLYSDSKRKLKRTDNLQRHKRIPIPESYLSFLKTQNTKGTLDLIEKEYQEELEEEYKKTPWETKVFLERITNIMLYLVLAFL